MKNKKGFTLVELLAVIAIMAIIAVFVFPNIVKIASETKQKKHNAQIDLILAAAKAYGEDHLNDLSSSCTEITVGNLLDWGYILSSEKDDSNQIILKDPLDNSSMNGLCICIKYETAGSSYRVTSEMCS